MPQPETPAQREIYTVSRLNAEVRRLLESGLPLLWVEGELSNLARPSSGHWYFTLKDAGAQVRCAMFRNRNQYLGLRPREGMQVLLRARVSLYEARGDYQLIVEHMEEAGHGALQRAFEDLKRRLAAEGLFDAAHKRPLPAFPRRLGVITSPTGAAIRDVLSVLRRRFPALPVLVYPVPVQGEGAAERIAEAIRLASARRDCDVLILTRGGGSLEDLWAFFDERVVRAVFACPVPVISAVGHETDVSLCDEVADLRAPTPSAAGELAVPDRGELLAHLDSLKRRLTAVMHRRVGEGAARLSALGARPALRRPSSLLEPRWQRVDEASSRAARAVSRAAERVRHRLTNLALMLRALDPRVGRRLSVIDRRQAVVARAAVRARSAVERQLGHWHARLDVLVVRPSRVRAMIAERHAELQRLTPRLRAAVERGLGRRRGHLDAATASLRALSPMAVVQRGYALVWRDRDQTLVRSVSAVAPDDGIHVSVADGEIAARVTGTRSETQDDG